ncbi:MAG TPA: hypothetical protein VL463_20585 [Kofleriaceae bacterium]|nr:hypothetical protein [Kofleriaceae bacterium]HTL36251.1 hypothetical protein [Kofleriaceae bacterium]
MRAPVVKPQTLRNLSSEPARLQKIVIGSLDDPGKGVEAQYNPRELTIEKSVPWTPHKVTKANEHDLEFTGGSPRTLSLELTFDGMETGRSVEQAVLDLAELATVRDRDAKDEDHLRPHLVVAVWGDKLSKFKGVIESLTTKYTMFLADGTPVRATCTVKLKEAENPGVAKKT